MNKFVAESQMFLTYDDVLLFPEKSLPSRESASLHQAVKDIVVSHPFIPANMDTISGHILCKAQLESGGIAVLHRYMSMDERLKVWISLDKSERLFISIGVSQEEIEIFDKLHDAGVRNFCVDIAHGYADAMAKALLHIQEKSDCMIMAGNVATVDGAMFLANHGVTIIKIGIGPGSHCTTRIVTGCGVPQLSAIMQIAEFRNDHKDTGLGRVKLIADGGLKNSGDITKALVAGADFVMSGWLCAGCPETNQPTDDGIDLNHKIYRGMASKDAQVGWRKARNLADKTIVPEGDISIVPLRPSYKEVLEQLLGGIRSGMSYVGCKDIYELHERAKFIRVSTNTIIENRPWGKV